MSNQVEIGQQVQELLGSLTHVCAHAHTRFARASFPKANKLKMHTEGGQRAASECLGSCDFCTSDPCTVCPKHALQTCSPSLPRAPMVTHADSCSEIRAAERVMRAALSLGVGRAVHTCAWCTCVRSVTHATAPRWLASQQQMRHSHEQALAQRCVLLSVRF